MNKYVIGSQGEGTAGIGQEERGRTGICFGSAWIGAMSLGSEDLGTCKRGEFQCTCLSAWGVPIIGCIWL